MKLDWDSSNIEHIAEHNVTPAEAEQVINNDPLEVPPSQFCDGEERFAQLGETDAGRILFVIVTERDELLRVVTAYDASPRWRRFYADRRSIDYGKAS